MTRDPLWDSYQISETRMRNLELNRRAVLATYWARWQLDPAPPFTAEHLGKILLDLPERIGTWSPCHDVRIETFPASGDYGGWRLILTWRYDRSEQPAEEWIYTAEGQLTRVSTPRDYRGYGLVVAHPSWFTSPVPLIGGAGSRASTDTTNQALVALRTAVSVLLQPLTGETPEADMARRMREVQTATTRLLGLLAGECSRGTNLET